MPGERISQVHGTARPADPATGAHDALVLAMYHPAFALYDGSNRSTLFTDIQGLPTTLEAARARRTEGPPDAGTGSEPAATVTGFEAPAPAEALAMPGLLDAPAVSPDGPSAAPSPVDASQLVGAVAGGGSDADPDADQLTLF